MTNYLPSFITLKM